MIWKPIPGYEGLYEINGVGEVRSLSRKVMKGGRHVSVHGRMLKAIDKNRARHRVTRLHVCLSRESRMKWVDPMTLRDGLFGVPAPR